MRALSTSAAPNTLQPAETTSPKLASIVADATRLDHLDDDSYDLVHSNSVIEHVGAWTNMVRMAGHVRRLEHFPPKWVPVWCRKCDKQRTRALSPDSNRVESALAPAYYLQTSNFWFPYEPHVRFAGFHWLPQQLQYRLLMTCNLGFGGRRPSVDAAMRGVQSTAMIDRRQLATLFPDARIERERFCGLTKSLMAIREAR